MTMNEERENESLSDAACSALVKSYSVEELKDMRGKAISSLLDPDLRIRGQGLCDLHEMAGNDFAFRKMKKMIDHLDRAIAIKEDTVVKKLRRFFRPKRRKLNFTGRYIS